jgi:hypothetical protein
MDDSGSRKRFAAQSFFKDTFSRNLGQAMNPQPYKPK